MENIYDFNLPDLDDENFKTMLKHKNVSVKRIVSNTLKTPQTFKQDVDEWVVVLQGCAKLEMDGIIHKLKKGDSLFIEANKSIRYSKLKKSLFGWLFI